LTKSQAARLVDEVAGAGDDIDANRRAVAVALASVLGADGSRRSAGDGAGDDRWAGLVRCAASVGGWDDARVAVLLAAGGPSDGVAVLEALWDLAAELNERRDLEPPA
jgi:hypothetical protein